MRGALAYKSGSGEVGVQKANAATVVYAAPALQDGNRDKRMMSNERAQRAIAKAREGKA